MASQHVPTDDETMGANIKALRLRAGLSQTALAEAMREAGQEHWRQTTVSRVESGSQQLRAGEVRRLTEILGGDVMAGTSAGEAAQRVGRWMKEELPRHYLVRRLRALDEHLTTALDELHQLRWMFDDDYAADPEDEVRWEEAGF